MQRDILHQTSLLTSFGEETPTMMLYTSKELSYLVLIMSF